MAKRVNGQTFAQWHAIALGRKPVDDDTWGAIYVVLRTAWESGENASAWYCKLQRMGQ